MQVITFANNKGGVGKTTSALGVAHELGRRGSKVLFVDADPQGNATTTFNFDPAILSANRAYLHLALTEYEPRPLADMIRPAAESYDLWAVPSSRLLAQQEKVFGMAPDYINFFKRQFAGPVSEGFDYVIIDTAPNLGPLTLAALAASDRVFVPMQPDLFNSEGTTALLDMAERIRSNFNDKLRVGGIFFTKYHPSYRRALHKQYVEELSTDEALGALVMRTTIRENVALSEAQSMKQSIFDWSPDSNGAADYRLLTDEIISRL